MKIDRTWEFTENNTVIKRGNNFSWIGSVSNETRHMIYENLRKQGISIESHGITFFDKCVIRYLDASEKAIKNIIKDEMDKLLTV